MALLMDAARYRRYSSYRAILLRRTSKEARRTVVDAAWEYYPHLLGKPIGGGAIWEFPSGATVEISGIEQERDVSKYDGSSFQYIGFDELSAFTEWQYIYMSARLRSTDPNLPASKWYIRATTNPLGPHIEWVRKHFRWWTYQPGDGREDEFAGPYARPGQVLHVLRSATGEERIVRKGTPHALGRVFIPAKLSDNPALRDTGYADQLMRLDPVTRKQLLDGDWSVRAEPGTFFQRDWFEKVLPGVVYYTAGVVPRRRTCVAPGLVKMRCRAWDRAATAPGPGKDPDWTVGLRLALGHDNCFYIEDVVRLRAAPFAVAALVQNTAEDDQLLSPPAAQVLEQEGGSAGAMEVASYVRALAGMSVRAVRPSTNKEARARPVAAQAAPPTSNIKIVAGSWNAAFLEEMESFPSTSFHDDQVDACSLAFAYLAPHARRRKLGETPTGFIAGEQTGQFAADLQPATVPGSPIDIEASYRTGKVTRGGSGSGSGGSPGGSGRLRWAF